MNYEKVIMAVAVLSFIFSVGLSGVQAKSIENSLVGSESNQRAILILESIEAGSYKTWRKLVNPNSRTAKAINEEDFNEFVKARNLARRGKYFEAMEIFEKLKFSLNLSDEKINNIVSSLGMVNDKKDLIN